MTGPHVRPVPANSAMVREQIGVVGLAVRREVGFLAAGLVLLIVGTAAVALSGSLDLVVDGEPAPRLNPEDLGYLAAMIGAAFPLVVWKGEAFWKDTQLWSLPVARPKHALVKVGAGWCWLMMVVGAGLLALVAVLLLTEGTLGVEVTRRLIVGDGIEEAVWTTPAWQWVMPFTAATAAYLLASTLLLATEHPWIWGAGLWLLFLLGVSLSEAENIPRVQAVAHMLFVSWPDLAMSGGGEALRQWVYEPSGDRVMGWRQLPSAMTWAGATAAWFALGLGGVWAAARRHRE